MIGLIICYDNEQYANTGIQASSRNPLRRNDHLPRLRAPKIPEAKKLFPKDLHAHDGCGASTLLRRDGERGLSHRLDEQSPQGLELQGCFVPDGLHPLLQGLRLRDAAVHRSRPASAVECGLYPIWDRNNEKREYDYSFRPASMRSVSEYPKAAGPLRPSACRAHRHAAKFATMQWQMMGVKQAEALIKATDAKNLVNMGSVRGSRGRRGGDRMSSNPPNLAPGTEVQDLYVVSEGKKRGSTREVRPRSGL